MRDIDKAREILTNENKTCVLCRGDVIHASDKMGISPMLDFILEKIDLSHFSVADKIVGKAAALLFVLAEVDEVYAEVMSKAAQAVLEKYGISYSYGTLTEYIVNRKGEGMCPMEHTVMEIDDPHKAFDALCEKRQQLLRAVRS